MPDFYPTTGTVQWLRFEEIKGSGQFGYGLTKTGLPKSLYSNRFTQLAVPE